MTQTIDWTLPTAPWGDNEQVVRAAVPTVYLTQRSAAIWGSQASRSEWICSGRPQPVKHPGYLGPNWAAARQHPLVQTFERKYRKPEPSEHKLVEATIASLKAEVARLRDDQRLDSEEWGRYRARARQERDALEARNRELEQERDEFERKGKELCCAYGTALMQIGELKREPMRSVMELGVQPTPKGWVNARAEEAEQRVRELEEGWKAAVDVVRDAVLYERYGMAEGGFTGDQINAVLGIIDDYGYAPAAPSANVESEGACKSDR